MRDYRLYISIYRLNTHTYSQRICRRSQGPRSWRRRLACDTERPRRGPRATTLPGVLRRALLHARCTQTAAHCGAVARTSDQGAARTLGTTIAYPVICERELRDYDLKWRWREGEEEEAWTVPLLDITCLHAYCLVFYRFCLLHSTSESQPFPISNFP
jgi:hypothetical protein